MNDLLKRISKLPPEKLKLLEKRLKENNIDINQNILDIKENQFESIEPVDDRDYYSLSSAQKRMYILDQIENVGISYNIPMIMIIEGNLNINQFEKTMKELVRRHESFRTAFQVVDGEPVQKIYKNVEFEIAYSEAREDEIKRKMDGFVQPFDLSKAPLLRVELIKLSTNKHLFMMDTHHIISDGVSTGIFIKDFINLYKGKELSELSIQYKDFSQWQNNILKTKSIEKQKRYWLDKFRGEIPVLNMLTDYRRPSIKSFEGDVVKFEIEKELVEDINKLAAKTGTTLYMILLGAYNVLLSKYTGQEDIVVGTPVAGRAHSDLDNIIGMFVNTVAMRNYPKGEKSFREFLETVKETSLEAYENQDYQFEELISQLDIVRDFSKNPLFDVMFTLQNIDIENMEIDELKFIPYEFENKVSKFDITLSAIELKEKITFDLQYCTKLFRRETIERLSKHYVNILKEVTNNVEIKLSEIEILSKGEKNQLLYDFNSDKVEYPKDKTIHELFEEQVKRTPNNIAVIYEDKQLTYDELNVKANKLARVLRKKGVKADSIVGIMLEKSLEMIVGILGILKAGGAYLPMDPDYPKERVEYILKDSKSKLLLTRGKSLSNIDFLGETIDLLDEELYRCERNNLERINNSKSLAYIIYTSGSTGNPKGVMVEHKSVINTLVCMERKYPLGYEDTHLLKTKFTFDVSVSELFGWFVGSGKLVIMSSNEEKDISAIINLIEEHKVTHINFVPAMLNVFMKSIGDNLDKINSLKYVFAAGEELKTDIASNFYSKFNTIRLENLYGPTETSIYSSKYSVDKNLKYISIPIGTPIENTQIYIMNNNQLAPIGVAGELCISGDGLARGYLNKPELTAEKFIENPYKSGERIYKTGDLARWLPDGNVEFLGRIDHQVKIRGFRIELGEIEAQLLKKEKIKESVVIAREDEEGNKYICAYIVGTVNFTVKELREYLLKELPEYMIPSYFVQLEAMPLTPNGKIDRKRLPKPEGAMDIGIEYEGARNEIEESLVKIWRDILKVDVIGINDNFFELGGHSLKAMSLVNKICKDLNVEISLGEIFRNSTIKSLGEHIRNLDKSIYSTIEIVEGKEYYPLSSAQKRMYILNQIENAGISYNMPMMMTIKGELNINQFEKAMQELVRRHESFRTAFELIEGRPVQKIYKDVEFEIVYSELREGEIKDEIENFIQPFDLSKAPLLRVELIKLSKNNHLFMMDTHHIISDGISTAIFIKEFIALYENKELPKLRIQYKDFSQWQNNILKAESIEKQKEYWLDKFKDEIPVLNMPTDYMRPSTKSFEGNLIKFEIEKDLKEDINKLAAKTGTTLYMVLLGAYTVLLSKYTGQEDIVVGTPVAGRAHSDLDNIIGMFVNTIVMRNYPKGEMSFKEFLEKVKDTALEAYENQDYQFEELISNLDINRDFSKNPLFDVMFTLQNMDMENIEIDGLKFSSYEFKNRISKFDITLSAIETKEKIIFNLEYCTKLFKRETVERLSKHYINVLKEVVNNVEIKLSEIEMLSKEEKKQLLYDFNATNAKYPEDKTIHELFEEQVKNTPNNIAVICEENKLTYRELNAKANKLARVLRECGVKANSVVGIMLERSLEMIVGIIGILKAGGAYLPIESEYPKDRIEYMIQDSKVDILLTRHKLLKKIDYSGEVLDIDDEKINLQSEENLKKVNTSLDLAYMIYTSGSTGKPKGVMIEHKSVTTMLQWRRKEYKLNSVDSVLQLFSYAFDGFVTSFYTPIISGAKVVILSDIEAKDVFVIKDKIVSHNITHFITVPSMCLAIMDSLTTEEAKSLRTITLAGENLTSKVVERCKSINKEVEIVNEYGPTENSVVTTIMRNVDVNKKITIGKPRDNTRIFIVDKNNKVQPIGVAGELCISGDGLARGYLNKPELTGEKFILNPFEPNIRMYKTGDLARWLSDGNIEFLGRIDHQVKIRGFRIELGEIESQLLKNEKVRETVVISREDENNNKYICAYIVGDNEINAKELREYLSKELPEYMVPSYFVQLEKIPVTPNGKVDRRALEQYDKFIDIGTVYETPRNFIEAKMVSVWEEILGIERIGVRDDFFDLGGDSIKAIRIVSKLIVDFEIKINDIFECKTISQLSKRVSFKKNNLKMKIDSFKEVAVTLENSSNSSICDKKLNSSIMNYRELNKAYDQIHVIKKRKYKNIFLTGSTGYLGMHILHELLNNDDVTIHLLIRGKNKEEAEEKLMKNFELYFGSNIYEGYSDKISIINGDITKYNFGLEKELYEVLAETVDCIINSAANVKHYGHYEDFYEVNVKAVERLIEFAKFGQKKDLNHISTISVGSEKVDKKDMLFSEYNDELETHIDNYYIKTKIEGERVVLKAREDGINTNIFRVGNVVFNSKTGVFQRNIDEDAFYSQLKSYINLGAMPKINSSYDFSFVDYVSRAIILLYDRADLKNEMYHIFNPNSVTPILIGDLLNKLGLSIEMKSFEDFLEYVYDNYNREDLREHIDNFLLHSNILNNEENKAFVSICEKTQILLKQADFIWPSLNLEHMDKMIDYCKKVNFLE